MLTNLHISNIVLIEKLNLEFGAGLNVMTGETGAGKSILLDALSLALGARSDTGLVRHGCADSSVIAEFDAVNKKLRKILKDNGIDCNTDTLVLHRTLSAEGKSRAWVNDIPVSIKILKQIGDELVEIHGQFASHTLLDPATYRQTLDTFAIANYPEYKELLQSVKNAYSQYNFAEKHLSELKDMLDKSALEFDFLKHNISELRALNLHTGEEEELANRRTAMMNLKKDAALLAKAVNGLSPNDNNLDAQLFSVAHTLERIKTRPNPYQKQIDKLYDMGQSISEIISTLSPTNVDINELDEIEERLFAIRAAARKHRVNADELIKKLHQMEDQLQVINNSDEELKKTEIVVEQKKKQFEELANDLTAARKIAATELRKRLLTELPDLKLEHADFKVEITKTDASDNGVDNIVFMIKTNPGMPFAPLYRIASGGELARLMLAMRVVLSFGEDDRIFVFDEVDAGVDGATASAVGLRLKRLAKTSQALVITHSVQVAGYADKHFKISKTIKDNTTITIVSEITNDSRVKEIARIISGTKITPESITMAKTLIKN